MAGGPEPEAGAREGWFGTTGEGERVDPGGALRVAVAVLGAVDLVWWLCVRLLYLVGRRADEEPGRPGARYLGIGWRRAPVDGGALCEAWIGWVPIGAEPRDGWPVGWRWDASPLEPPGWSFNPECDDRAPEDPGSIGILVRGEDGRARLAAWSTPWGDRWTAPGFDAARLVRLLRAEITDAELRAEERDDEGDPDAPAADDDLPPIPDGLGWFLDDDGSTALENDTHTIGGVYPPQGFREGWSWFAPGIPEGAKGCEKSREAALAMVAAHAWQQERRELVAAERPPATCPTGQDPADNRAADLPALPLAFCWEAFTDSAAVARWNVGGCAPVAELRPINPERGTGWRFEILGSARLGPPEIGEYSTRDLAARRIARELRRRFDEAATRDGLERQAEGGQS